MTIQAPVVDLTVAHDNILKKIHRFLAQKNKVSYKFRVPKQQSRAYAAKQSKSPQLETMPPFYSV